MSGLTEAEYKRMFAAVDGLFTGGSTLVATVERIIADREKALRESIAQDMEREGRRMAQAREGWPPVSLKFANIARGGAR